VLPERGKTLLNPRWSGCRSGTVIQSVLSDQLFLYLEPNEGLLHISSGSTTISMSGDGRADLERAIYY